MNYERNEGMINYVRGIRPYPGGMDWIGAKRVFTVMNLNKTHFVIMSVKREYAYNHNTITFYTRSSSII